MSLSEIFGLFFDMDPRFWMNLQTEFDMRVTMPRRTPLQISGGKPRQAGQADEAIQRLKRTH
jgi:plasmid maintenance system antidote protein VapI